MIEFIIWSLTVFGIANGIAVSALLKPVRDNFNPEKFFGKLIRCPMCLGFWAGAFVSYLYYSPTGNYLLDAFLGSSVSWLIYLRLAGDQHTK